ncbi:M1 family metallopeptidase [Elizabethkingia anophelis]|uniref:M1 family metallopeptidase n=1 Tax=Elizabethkingia anophelis TaxID=1117645 RepID=UPI000999679B|nr:M1 family metallopeptidase [Elizabethkingia anophelis]MCT4011778.1 M1 family metallopeptidase [Elizabethkingia anophelis]MDV3897239.1 aminopeptidase [Elizabethkingia anophelis]OPC49645.1 aminopeptidase [Elizabethkingia anophelis]
MRKIFFSIALLGMLGPATAQELYMPRNIKKAYANGTRDLSGAPGKNYWQNKGIYDIQIKVNADTKIVSGSETILYDNNSPDQLDILAIRFVNNMHKPQSPRSGFVSKDFLSSGLKIKSFSINGESYKIDSDDWSTVEAVELNKPLASKAKAEIKIEWEYPLSVQSGREGQIDPNTFYVAYSYPRVSVYDDYNGWDFIQHSDRQEFYNDFNDYSFAISAPKNYVVWSTGDFLNPEEVLQPEYLKRFKESLKSDKIIHVANEAEMKSGKVTKQNDWNVWKFKANHISDFCFALSNHYVWDASSVQLKTKRVSVQAGYKAGAKDFEQYTGWMRYNIDWFSKNWPGVEYPYPVMTAIQGYADMEYPMMINDSTVPDNFQDARLTADHEIAHTYFPFYMGINETRYAYMDEGWATTLEYLIGIDENGKEAADTFYNNFRTKKWITSPATEQDQPLITMSTQVSGAGYGNNSYVKSSLSYLALKEYLGDALFKKALHHYMDNWNGKHPIPWDYFYSMNTGSGKDLTWFWNNWFYSNNYIDLKISDAAQQNNKLNIKVDNVGGFAVPFDAVVTYTDGTKENKRFTPAVWEKDQKKTTLELPIKKQVKSVNLDGGIFMDYTPQDNLKVF